MDKQYIWRLVLLHNAESGRGNAPWHPQRGCESLRESRLAGAKIAFKAYYVARL